MSSKSTTLKLKPTYRVLGILALLFGAMTLKEGASTLFLNEARAAAGNYVPFVLIFNSIAGIFYMLTGAGILLKKNWALPMALLLAVSTGVVFGLLGIHILRDLPFETRTVYAMSVRTAFWFSTAIALHRSGVFGALNTPRAKESAR